VVGKEQEVLTNSGREGCHLNGAYNPITRDIIIQNYTLINADASMDVFQNIEDFYPNKS